MSVYTTTVRYICEYYAHLDESVGLSTVDDVINKSWQQIFDDFPIFDENYREQLCHKILRHYYMREIGSESVGLWKLWLSNTMREIMPYYNQLYESTKLKFDPFITTKYTRSGIENAVNSETTTEEQSGSAQSTTTASDESTTTDNGTTTGKITRRKSDTPQGGIDGVESNTYLSEAEITDSSGNTSNKSTNNSIGNTQISGTTTGKSNGKKDGTNDKNYNETIEGKTDSVPFSDLLVKYRESFLNIDMEIIYTLSGLFLNLY